MGTAGKFVVIIKSGDDLDFGTAGKMLKFSLSRHFDGDKIYINIPYLCVFMAIYIYIKMLVS